MNFIDYEASYITPQLTLLKKFNKTWEFLRGVNNFYIHLITLHVSGSPSLYDDVIFISQRKEPYTSFEQINEDATNSNGVFSSLFTKINRSIDVFYTPSYYCIAYRFFLGAVSIGKTTNNLTTQEMSTIYYNEIYGDKVVWV